MSSLMTLEKTTDMTWVIQSAYYTILTHHTVIVAVEILGSDMCYE